MEKLTIRFKNCGIYYEKHTNPGKPTVIMLHPYGSSGLVFKEQVLSLKRLYQIIVIDFPGHGQSEFSKVVKIKDMPEIINMILNKEEISKTHFIGVSEGAEVAQAFGQLFPNKIKSLVAVSSISIFHNSYKVLKSSMFFTNIKLSFLRIFSFKKYKNWFVERSSRSEDGKEAFLLSMERFSRKSKKVKKGYKRFYNLGDPKISYPTYLVCGDDDLEVIKDASFQYEQRTPMTTLEGYKRAKQVVFLDNMRFFNERIKLFFERIEQMENK